MHAKRSKGFSLLELMIVVTIIAVLTALAVPAYQRYAFRTRRADGKEFLATIVSAEERRFTNYNAYTNTLSDFNSQTTSEKGYYTVAVTSVTLTTPVTNGTCATATGTTATYLLTATPTGAQVGDLCGKLLIDNTGSKCYTGVATNGSCW